MVRTRDELVGMVIWLLTKVPSLGRSLGWHDMKMITGLGYRLDSGLSVLTTLAVLLVLLLPIQWATRLPRETQWRRFVEPSPSLTTTTRAGYPSRIFAEWPRSWARIWTTMSCEYQVSRFGLTNQLPQLADIHDYRACAP